MVTERYPGAGATVVGDLDSQMGDANIRGSGSKTSFFGTSAMADIHQHDDMISSVSDAQSRAKHSGVGSGKKGDVNTSFESAGS